MESYHRVICEKCNYGVVFEYATHLTEKICPKCNSLDNLKHDWINKCKICKNYTTGICKDCKEPLCSSCDCL